MPVENFPEFGIHHLTRLWKMCFVHVATDVTFIDNINVPYLLCYKKQLMDVIFWLMFKLNQGKIGEYYILS